MEKTAMMQMLEWVRKTFPMDLDTPRMIEEKIESLLKVEKEQIMNAWDKGDCCIDLPNGDWEQKYKSAEEYYNKIYGNDK
jgi:hypothetical protein